MDSTERKLKIWELAVRGGVGAFVTLLVGLFGYFGNLRLVEIQQQLKDAELRQAQIISTTQIVNSQKELETNIATKLWGDLTREFFPKEGKRESRQVLEEQMFRLRLTALNFQDIAINLKPFFEHLDERLESDDDKTRLRTYAQQIARRQAYRLVFEGGLEFGEITFTKDKSKPIPGPYPVEITVKEVGEDEASVLIVAPFQKPIGPFAVSYFDMPLIDNIKLKANETRLAVLLISTDPSAQQAKLRVVGFQPYMATDRFDLKEQARILQMTNPNIPPVVPRARDESLVPAQ